MAQTRTVHTLERARDAFADIKEALEEKTSSSLDEVPVESYDDVIANIPSGGSPVLDNVTVIPDTVSQTIYPEQGVDGFDEIYVQAVDSNIDENIQAENIKQGVYILGVEGTYEGSSDNLQSNKDEHPYFDQGDIIVTPDSGYDGMRQVTLIKDSDLIPGNIKNGVEIFGVYGNYEGDLQSNKTVTPDLSQGNIAVTPDSGYNGLEQVTILKDSNLIPNNIKDGQTIFGVSGNLITEMVPEFKNSNPVLPADGGLPVPETAELRALLTINNVIHLFCNGNHYTFDDTTETWSLVDSNEHFCGKDAYGQPDMKENGAVLIGDYVVWIGINASGFVSVAYYNITTGIVSNYISLGAPTGFIACMTTDGKDLYLFDKNAKKIRKVEIDFVNGTATSDYINITFTNNLRRMAFLNDHLYGYDVGSPTKLISVDLDNLTYTEEATLDSNIGDRNRMFAVTDDAIFIGSGTVATDHIIYKWDGTTLSTYDTPDVGVYSGKSAWTVYKNKLYMYGFENGNFSTYIPVFEARARKVGEHLVITPTSNKQTFDNNIKYTKIVVNPTS